MEKENKIREQYSKIIIFPNATQSLPFSNLASMVTTVAGTSIFPLKPVLTSNATRVWISKSEKSVEPEKLKPKQKKKYSR